MNDDDDIGDDDVDDNDDYNCDDGNVVINQFSCCATSSVVFSGQKFNLSLMMDLRRGCNVHFSNKDSTLFPSQRRR